MESSESHAIADWLSALRHYVFVSTTGNLVWEVVQLPLYTVWERGTLGEIGFAAVHCTGGDIVIATMSLVVGLMFFGQRGWPEQCFTAVGLATVAAGLAYTVYSEWINTAIRGTWAYSTRMPVLPWLGTGLSPVMQWLVVPFGALYAARRMAIDR